MKSSNLGWLVLVEILVTSSLPFTVASGRVRTGVFLSPKIELEPGLVSNKFYFDVDFPRGHIAVKSFDAEIVDEAGNPVPLYDTYLHHWIVERFFVREGLWTRDVSRLNSSDYISGRNSGICNDGVLDQFFGLGSETRRTATHIPGPYGIEIGNPAEIPAGFEETWAINVHAIDTRGVADRIGCIECRCDLYNVTRDESGRPLSPDYKGGLLCCYDGARCRRNETFNGIKRTLYLRYTVTWVDMDSSIVPVKVYIFDITDRWRRSRNSTGINAEHDCMVEYDIESCRSTGSARYRCIDDKRISLDMPFSGYVIYGVGHQHVGGSGSALSRKDGKPLCNSVPIYGTGVEAGNEAGYVVGMSTCYPKPGSVKISKGETLILELNYSSIQQHTGVMGLFYLLVAEKLPQ
ncbi:(+)-neomenthol dehydrogenase-like [Hibiscus syriacus]|uniref:(+)-neomenthol dehydrogenase-like n=1 Tax=Hibiscus syriacus TaxID=106335 RepID=A0A6A2Z8Q1_HIBSY|nr:uncharacterized protein LOC120149273 [Hibiscus syriacus]KAE8688087.1 (+)-neomenthol dehydrogenase-like [Hibiscus syriacus]